MTDNWCELIAGIQLDMQQEIIILKPYQTVWIANKCNEKENVH